TCGPRRPPAPAISGVPISYFRAPACRFLFTTAFDDFSKADFLRYVYNEEYVLVDPDSLGARARANADFLVRLFSGAKPRRLLDYGGGGGILSGCLRAAGFPEAGGSDPFRRAPSGPPAARFPCLGLFPVVVA